MLSTFEGVEDRYNGITVDSAKEECHIEDFSKKLDGTFSSKIIVSQFLIIFQTNF